MNVSGVTTLNNNTTCISSLNVSGVTTLSNNLSVTGTITSSAAINSNSGISNFKYIYISNPDGRVTHFSYAGNNQNYIRGKLNIDQDDLFVGGSINTSGNLTVSNITLSSNGKINCVDDYHYIQLDQTTDTLTLQEYGKISFNIGVTKTQKALMNFTTFSIFNNTII